MKNLINSIALFFILASTSFLCADITYTVKNFTQCTEQEIDQLACMRITAFKEFPYLYEGSKQYELEYLNEYQQKAIDGFLVQAWDKQNLVGILTGCALTSDIEIVRDGARLLANQNVSIQNYYYIGEAIITPEYQGKKILPHMLWKLGKTVVSLGKYSSLCFLTVIREDNDSRKPELYKPTEPLWLKLGCQKRADIRCSFEWPTIMTDGSVQNIFNDVEFWTYEPGINGFKQLATFIGEAATSKAIKILRSVFKHS